MMERTCRTVRKDRQGKTWTLDAFQQVLENGITYRRIHEPWPDVIWGHYVNLQDLEGDLEIIPVYRMKVIKSSDQKLAAEGC